MGEISAAPSGFGKTRPLDHASTPVSRNDRHWRDDFEVDADRVLYAPEFRRLAGVTQVISPQEDYVFHDRLTHSLKVAQTAERLAQKLIKDFSTDTDAQVAVEAAISPRVCYVAGLCHDLGHPPFGHVAEKQLQVELTKIERPLDDGTTENLPLRDSFEGNAQSFRIVSRLSLRKTQASDPDTPQEFVEQGLNLTWRSLAAISKYPWTAAQGLEDFNDRQDEIRETHGEDAADGMQASGAEQLTESKWSFYDTENTYLEHLVREGFILPDGTTYLNHRVIEAEIMDWSDDIAYAVHDLEDFFRANRVPLERLQASKTQDWEEILKRALDKVRKYEGISGDDEQLGGLQQLAEQHIIPQLPAEPFSGSRESHAAVQRFASAWIRYLQDATTLEFREDRFWLQVPLEARRVVEILKAITNHYVIDESTMEMMQSGQQRVISQLFDALFDIAYDVEAAVATKGTSRRRLPARLQEYLAIAFGVDNLDFPHAVARAVVDFICSLTDKQAGLLHQRLIGDSGPRLSPYWLNV